MLGGNVPLSIFVLWGLYSWLAQILAHIPARTLLKLAWLQNLRDSRLPA